MMKKILIISFVLLILISFVFTNEKTRVAVLDFSAKGIEKYLAEAIVENLITSLIDSGIFTVIERSQLKQLMKELSLQNSDDFNDRLRTELGELYGVELVILGSVTKIGSNITINARGVEVETGIAKFAKNLITDSENDIPFLIPLLVDIISGKSIDEDALKKIDKRQSKDRKSKKSKSIDFQPVSIASGKKILLGKKKANTSWDSRKIYTDNLDNQYFSQIVIEAEGNIVEFARVKIYCDDHNITVSDNFLLGKNNINTRAFDTKDKNGKARFIEKVSIIYSVISDDDDDATANIKVFGIR